MLKQAKTYREQVLEWREWCLSEYGATREVDDDGNVTIIDRGEMRREAARIEDLSDPRMQPGEIALDLPAEDTNLQPGPTHPMYLEAEHKAASQAKGVQRLFTTKIRPGVWAN